jgi:hypothetical protein
MSMLPRSPGFNPWQQALYGLSSGLMAAGSPGGFRNFGAGVGQGVGQFQDNQARLVREQILQQQFDMQKSDHEARQAEKDAAQKRQEALRSSAGGLLQTYDDADPVNDAFGPRTPAELSYARLQLETNPDGLLQQFGDWSKPTVAEPRKSRTRDVGDKTVFEEFNPQNGAWEPVSDAPRWAPKAEGGGLSLDINGDGVPDLVMGAGAGNMTEWKSKDIGFANRLENSLAGMAASEAEGYDPSKGAGATIDYLAQNKVGGLTGNFMTSDAGKKWYRNGKEVLAVILRKDTGAAVTDKEFDLYGPMYLPMPDDPPDVKENKKQAIRVILNSMRATTGIQQAPGTEQPAAPSTAPSAPDDPLGLRKP